MNDYLGEVTLCYRLTFQRQSKHSAQRVWAAITRDEEVSRWMGYPAGFDLRVGGEWFYDFSSKEKPDRNTGVVVRVETERALTYVWGLSLVEWTLTPNAEGCAYTFIQNGLPDRGPGEEELVAGWHEFIDRLDDHLDGKYLAHEERTAHWERLKAPYRERLDQVVRGEGR